MSIKQDYRYHRERMRSERRETVNTNIKLFGRDWWRYPTLKHIVAKQPIDRKPASLVRCFGALCFHVIGILSILPFVICLALLSWRIGYAIALIEREVPSLKEEFGCFARELTALSQRIASIFRDQSHSELLDDEIK